MQLKDSGRKQRSIAYSMRSDGTVVIDAKKLMTADRVVKDLKKLRDKLVASRKPGNAASE